MEAQSRRQVAGIRRFDGVVRAVCPIEVVALVVGLVCGQVRPKGREGEVVRDDPIGVGLTDELLGAGNGVGRRGERRPGR